MTTELEKLFDNFTTSIHWDFQIIQWGLDIAGTMMKIGLSQLEICGIKEMVALHTNAPTPSINIMVCGFLILY